MHYLSRVTLANRDPRQVARYLSMDAYRRHQVVWGLFPGKAVRDFLFRATEDGFLVLSESKPLSDAALWNIETKPYRPKLREGQRLNFMLTANPTVTRAGKRHDVLMDAKKRGQDQQAAAESWLTSRAERSGFSIETLRVLESAQHAVRKQSTTIRYTSAEYAGLLRVIDPDIFVKVLLIGMGHAKGFGCGLLLVKPGQ